MADIHQVPDNSLVKILSEVSVPEILQSGLTCQRWQFISEVVCENVHTLAVRTERKFESCDYEGLAFYDLKEADFNLVEYSGAGEASCFWRKLVDKFPNTTTFTIYDCSISASQMKELLRSRWAKKLSHLKIISSRKNLSSIWSAINSLSALKHLSLCNSQLSTVSIPPQIEEFFYTSYDFPEDISLALRRLDLQMNNDQTVCHLRRFGLEIRVFNEADVENIFEANVNEIGAAFDKFYNQLPAFASMLTRLTLTVMPIDIDNLQLICKRFPAIAYFDFQLEHPNIFDTQVWTFLAKLSHLTELSIRADEEYQIVVEPSLIEPEKLPTFPTLTRVRLSNCNRIHPHAYANVEALFPSAEQLSIQFMPRNFMEDDFRYEKMKLCHFCGNCLKLRKMIPDKHLSRAYDTIQLHLDIRHGKVQNVDIQFDCD